MVNVPIMEAFSKGNVPLLPLLEVTERPFDLLPLLASIWLLLNYAFGFPILLALDRPKSLKRALVKFAIKIPKLFVFTLAVGFLIYLGLLAVLVPGIMIALGFSLLIPTIMLENIPFRKIFVRTLELSQRKLRKLFILLSPWVLTYIFIPSLFSPILTTNSLLTLFSLSIVVTFTNSLLVSALASAYIMCTNNY